jgi:hypothetical protein
VTWGSVTNHMEQGPAWEADSHSTSWEILSLFGTWRFNTVFTRPHHWALFWSSRTQSTPPYPINPLEHSGKYVYHLLQSALCPHCLFMGFIWFSKQTANISLNSINQLIVMDMCCVFLCSMNWTFVCYLDEFRLQRVKIILPFMPRFH